MKITIAEASKLTGKSIPTLHRHTNSGKLSFSKNERDEKVVDISELERVYGTLNQPNSDNQENGDRVSVSELDNQKLRHENDTLKQENDNLKSQLSEAQEREQRLFELTDRLTKQNEVLMLQPAPRSRRTFTDILNYFIPSRQDSDTTEQAAQHHD